MSVATISAGLYLLGCPLTFLAPIKPILVTWGFIPNDGECVGHAHELTFFVAVFMITRFVNSYPGLEGYFLLRDLFLGTYVVRKVAIYLWEAGLYPVEEDEWVLIKSGSFVDFLRDYVPKISSHSRARYCEAYAYPPFTPFENSHCGSNVSGWTQETKVSWHDSVPLGEADWGFYRTVALYSLSVLAYFGAFPIFCGVIQEGTSLAHEYVFTKFPCFMGYFLYHCSCIVIHTLPTTFLLHIPAAILKSEVASTTGFLTVVTILEAYLARHYLKPKYEWELQATFAVYKVIGMAAWTILVAVAWQLWTSIWIKLYTAHRRGPRIKNTAKRKGILGWVCRRFLAYYDGFFRASWTSYPTIAFPEYGAGKRASYTFVIWLNFMLKCLIILLTAIRAVRVIWALCLWVFFWRAEKYLWLLGHVGVLSKLMDLFWFGSHVDIYTYQRIN
ncbi:hypothetical protein BDZ91DRAFT_745845 [Kalaharituber pfeilii]|nr:hypothetical protein BDZ91DRAFT_745845 [Kalaharituber pfeilii]